jgi:hypothetical protein
LSGCFFGLLWKRVQLVLRPFLHGDELILEMDLPVEEKRDGRGDIDQAYAIFVGGIDEPRITRRKSSAADFRVTRNIAQRLNPPANAVATFEYFYIEARILQQ